MTLNEHLSKILELAEEDRRRESIARAEKRKPKLIDQLMTQAKKGYPDGVIIDDKDTIFLKHLGDYFSSEGFSVEEVEPKRLLVSISR